MIGAPVLRSGLKKGLIGEFNLLTGGWRRGGARVSGAARGVLLDDLVEADVVGYSQ
jgi:hypothetical protein